MRKISIIGLGFVGGAMLESFKSLNDLEVSGYDKYKNIGRIEDTLDSDIIFLALPTPYDESTFKYDKSAILDTLEILNNSSFKGCIVIKSTVEPETTKNLSKSFTKLKLLHNPEFLTQRTALEDFNNQSHIVIGAGLNCLPDDTQIVSDFYRKHYPSALISICNSDESEGMKIFANSFYSVKVQFFNELYLICEKMGCSYETVKDLMLKNGWINPMHTQVPGPDGELSYGGACFPKDTNALLNFMREYSSPSKVLESTISERNEMRSDNINILKSK
jgi:UDPglucose 6-dehydrogenase